MLTLSLQGFLVLFPKCQQITVSVDWTGRRALPKESIHCTTCVQPFRKAWACAEGAAGRWGLAVPCDQGTSFPPGACVFLWFSNTEKNCSSSAHQMLRSRKRSVVSFIYQSRLSPWLECSMAGGFPPAPNQSHSPPVNNSSSVAVILNFMLSSPQCLLQFVFTIYSTFLLPFNKPPQKSGEKQQQSFSSQVGSQCRIL